MRGILISCYLTSPLFGLDLPNATSTLRSALGYEAISVARLSVLPESQDLHDWLRTLHWRSVEEPSTRLRRSFKP
ncbi:hypothetical protein F4776DRAFT_385097 [Hypoxylon sp. NC0597]|nr:hypothetical protein F4776DRAFT_385097 [Hypoxylon sp. NC0597]